MGPADSHEEVFLCHVRLYVLAEKWDIQPLKTLSKAKLHQALINFNLFAERVGDIVALLRYLYVNTPDNDGTKDDLRDLVMHYVVCHYTTIAVSEDFLNLMDEGGEWVRDCLTMLSSIIE